MDVLGKMRSPGSGWFAQSTDPDKKSVEPKHYVQAHRM